MSARPLPPGIDRPKRKDPQTGRQVSTGMLRARYRCKRCEQHPSGGQHSKQFPDVRARDGVPSGLAQAKRWLEDQRVSVRRGHHVSPNDRRTVAEYAARHLQLNARLRDSSRKIMVTRLRHLDATGLGAQRLQVVTRSDVQAWIADRSQVVAASTVRDVVGFLRGMFEAAIADGVVACNPCVRLSLPELPDRIVEPLSVQQVLALGDAMAERYAVGVQLQAALGLRVSELLGLQRADVDLHRRVVHVRRQLHTDGRTFVPLKTKASRRTVPLATPVALAVGAHIAEHGQAPDETVLISPHGNPVTHKVYQRAFRRAVAASGVEATTHDLRHHCASVLVASGVPVNVVAAHLGHGDGGALLLRVYAHLLPSAEDVARRALDAAWSSPGDSVSQRVSRPSVKAV